MRRTRTTGIIRAIVGWALVVAGLGTVGCANQYADLGTVDMAASKEAAEKSGIKKFVPQLPKKATRRGPVVTDDKPAALPSRGSIPK